MKRVFVLGTLVLAGALTVAVAAQQPAPPPQPSVDNLTVEKVRDNLWVIRGGGGNTAVFATANGLTIVDTKSPGWGQPLLDKIKTVSDKPITTVINTHTHYDHVSANVLMPATVEIIAQENTAKRLPVFSTVTGRGETENVFKANPGKGLAKRDVQGQVVDRLRRRSDQPVLLRSRRTPAATRSWNSRRCASCTPATRSPSKGLPIMDQDNGGSGVEYAATIRKAVAGVKNVDTIINGHTPAQTTPAEMTEFANYVADFVAHAQAAKKAGKTAAQAAAEWKNPERYKGFSTPNATAATAYAQVIMDETK